METYTPGGLEEGHRVAVGVHVPVNGGDDAVGHGAPELLAQGVADGQGRIPHLEQVGVPELCGGQAGAVNFEHGQIVGLIAAHQQRVVDAVVV